MYIFIYLYVFFNIQVPFNHILGRKCSQILVEKQCIFWGAWLTLVDCVSDS